MKTAFCALAIAAVAGSALAGTATYSGDNTGGDVFNRPVSLSGLSGVGTAVAYEATAFTVSASGTYTLEAAYDGWDGYALVYANSFDSNSPLANLINGDDDYSGPYTILPGSSASGVDGSLIGAGASGNFAAGGLNLTAGVTYWAVIAGFGNTDSGAYSVGIGGPGDVTIIPAPGALALVGLGGLAAARRRRA
jgi:MYXO-CTERM domain-containing protein